MIPEKKQNVKFPDNQRVLFLPLKQQIKQKERKSGGGPVLTEKQTVALALEEGLFKSQR